MALIKCKECGKEIRDEGVVCPHCGAPLPAQPPGKLNTLRALMSFLFIVIVIAIFSFFILPAFCSGVSDITETIGSEGQELDFVVLFNRSYD